MEKKVLGLYVPVNDGVAVQEGNRTQQLMHVAAGAPNIQRLRQVLTARCVSDHQRQLRHLNAHLKFHVLKVRQHEHSHIIAPFAVHKSGKAIAAAVTTALPALRKREPAT